MTQEIRRANVLGYCMGVRRAVEIAEKCLLDYAGKPVYTFGPLIHNERALSYLAEKGLKVLETTPEAVSALDGSVSPVVVIRAHGISPQVRALLEAKNAVIVDATCPRVVANQKKASEKARAGYAVIIAGDRNHGEVTAVAGSAESVLAAGAESIGRCYVVESVAEAEQLPLGYALPFGVEAGTALRAGTALADVGAAEKASASLAGAAKSADVAASTVEPLPKVVLLSQTTFSSREYTAIARVLIQKLPNLEAVDTICPATRERQDALWELSEEVDGIIVIGGKNSANTRRLYATAKSLVEHACHIEGAEEIPPEFFGLARVGLTAGASTPDFVIQEVEDALRNR